MIDDQRIRDDGVDRAGRVGVLALSHTVADHLAAAELHLLAVGREVALHADMQIRIREAHEIADGGAEHIGIGGAGDAVGHGAGPFWAGGKLMSIA